MQYGFVAQLNIAMLPIMVLLLIRLDIAHDNTRDYASRLFLSLITLLTAVLVLDPITWLLNGISAPSLVLLNWIVNALFFVLSVATTYVWFLYLCQKTSIRHRFGRSRRVLWLFALPVALVCVVLLVLPGKSGIFYLDEAHQYQRGTLFLLPYAASSLYFLMCAFVTLRAAFCAPTVEQRRQGLLLALTLIPPVAGMVIQAVFYGWWVARPLSVLTLLALYLGIQRQTVSSDSLTGLNNRKQMARHLEKKWRTSSLNASWCLIMLDIDHFKQINDSFGHITGDEALLRTAGLLKRVFADVGAFLCRYGGDEFVIILDCAGASDAEDLLRQLETLIQKQNDDSAYLYSLSFSAGYAFYNPSLFPTEAALLAQADQRMYAHKQQQS